MKPYDLGNFRAEIDMDATADWYARSNGWGCECGHCRNFLRLAGNRDLPPHILQILDELGLPPEKATYVGELYTDAAGIHYQFSYRLAGKMTEIPGADTPEHTENGHFCHEPYPHGAPGFPEPHFDLEFFASLPWVLEEL